ncbi:Potassium-transporting ATPase C chain (TC 3.A.3.7.1) [Cronobacter condimenti 1330]|uniref:Potassium-transporting ATPase KdpC subunit n=1 Tax=Cronobacter condimenti 1330 TaxID=1073999 RepID=K8AHA6_9ENTR|nr:potassium-transporting ATPase subunit KdpC [Cronobacter condimenti]ALB62085.1 potassium-transporting ATPase subunit C [Cronobacter condimenti 1330]CCJ73617.1 Potassium-transporting ATPase C chain (TC 3.A.3.7.1) [Cronobacter condimenti 1330]
MATLRPALAVLIFLTLITGGIYPLATTVLGQWWFKDQAQGSLIREQNEVRGSRLIGQAFTDAKYFQGRPSATAPTPYNPMASGASNLADSNPELDKQIAGRVEALRAANPDAPQTVPVELVTASASGLDYGISPEAAFWQAPRVAQARGISEAQVGQLIREATRTPLAGFLGQPVVNVLQLNLALDALQP